MTLFEENQESTDSANKLSELVLREMRSGSTITYDWVDAQVGMKRYSKQWQGFLRKLRNNLRVSRGWCLEPINGVGYRIMLSCEVVTVQMGRRSMKQIRQGTFALKELNAVKDEELDQLHKELKYRMRENIRATRCKGLLTRRVLAAASL